MEVAVRCFIKNLMAKANGKLILYVKWKKKKGNQTDMVKKIMRNPLFLGQKSEDATEKDKQIVTDLLDGVRSCTRYEEIEVDHCNGIVI